MGVFNAIFKNSLLTYEVYLWTEKKDGNKLNPYSYNHICQEILQLVQEHIRMYIKKFSVTRVSVIQCPVFASWGNMIVDTNETVYPTVVKVSCSPQYTFIGTQNTTVIVECGADKAWHPDVPICKGSVTSFSCKSNTQVDFFAILGLKLLQKYTGLCRVALNPPR